MIRSEQIGLLLSNWQYQKDRLPVLVDGSVSGLRIIGDADSFGQADALGKVAGIAFGKVSHAIHDATGLQCYVLRP